MGLNLEILPVDAEEVRTDLEVEIVDKDSQRASPSGAADRGRGSKYEPISQKWSEIGDDQALLIEGLAPPQIQALSHHMSKRFGRANVAVRRAEKEDGTYKVLVCARRNDI